MRYIVEEGSESGHCCFKASVLDTDQDELSNEYIVCECFDLKQAQMICDLLNAKTQKDRQPD